jgi:LPXTG-motif cell wall-anchored protein
VQDLIQIARNSWIVMLAGLAIVVGLGMVGYGMISGPPARSSLQVVEGTISEASRVTRRSRRTGTTSSYFEMTLKPRLSATELKLRVPTIEISESDVRSLIGGPVRAEFDSEQDVYVLSRGSREVLTYANTLARRNLNLRQYHVDGIALMIAGAVALAIGLLLGYRKRRREVADNASVVPR